VLDSPVLTVHFFLICLISAYGVLQRRLLLLLPLEAFQSS
jgi:hypothetical protein